MVLLETVLEQSASQIIASSKTRADMLIVIRWSCLMRLLVRWCLWYMGKVVVDEHGCSALSSQALEGGCWVRDNRLHRRLWGTHSLGPSRVRCSVWLMFIIVSALQMFKMVLCKGWHERMGALKYQFFVQLRLLRTRPVPPRAHWCVIAMLTSSLAGLKWNPDVR